MGSEDQVLAEILRRLVEVYSPQCVYLFGSRARGEAGPDSDYDLMLVVGDETPASLRSSGRAYEALWGLRASADVVVWTRSAFDERLHLKASFPSTVVREGKLLYAA